MLNEKFFNMEDELDMANESYILKLQEIAEKYNKNVIEVITREVYVVFQTVKEKIRTTKIEDIYENELKKQNTEEKKIVQ